MSDARDRAINTTLNDIATIAAEAEATISLALDGETIVVTLAPGQILTSTNRQKMINKGRSRGVQVQIR